MDRTSLYLVRYNGTFRERKAARKEYYLRYVHGWKLRPCTACNGSGYYDHDGCPSCGSCEGTGKERYKPVGPGSVEHDYTFGSPY